MSKVVKLSCFWTTKNEPWTIIIINQHILASILAHHHILLRKFFLPKENCVIRIVNFDWSTVGAGGRSFDGASSGGFGLGLKELDDSTYTLPILEKITVGLHSCCLGWYILWFKLHHYMSRNFLGYNWSQCHGVLQGLDLKFPVDNEMLRGCYGNRPSCLAKDLPAEVINFVKIVLVFVKSFQNL